MLQCFKETLVDRLSLFITGLLLTKPYDKSGRSSYLFFKARSLRGSFSLLELLVFEAKVGRRELVDVRSEKDHGRGNSSFLVLEGLRLVKTDLLLHWI